MGNKSSSTKDARVDPGGRSASAKYKGERNAKGQKHGQATINYPSGAGISFYLILSHSIPILSYGNEQSDIWPYEKKNVFVYCAFS